MKLTTLLGTHEIDLTPHKRRKGINNIVRSIIDELKVKANVRQISNQDRSTLHMQIRKQLLKKD